MNDIVKSNNTTRKNMTLDSALKTIELANERIKAEIDIRDRHRNVRKSSELDIIGSSFNKIVGATAASYVMGIIGGAFMQVGFETAMTILMVPIGAGLVSSVSLHFFPRKVAKVLSPKKYKAYNQTVLTDGLFKELAEEEFNQKEQQILERTSEAIAFINKELEETGRSVMYSSTEGFRVESPEPLNVSEWDALRVETMRTKGVKSIGIKPVKAKELTA